MTDIRDIAARASTLFERLRGACTPVSADHAARRLETWRGKAAKGDRAQFARRLAWLGTSEADVLPLLGHVRADGALPSWTTILEDALARDSGADPVPPSQQDIPFVDLLRAFVPADHGMPEELVAALLHQLSVVAGPVFYLEFAVARDQGVSYAEFAASPGRLAALIDAYPVLGRLLSLTVEMWIVNTRELFEAAEQDRRAIEELFLGGAPLGEITRFRASYSDAHDHGRTVTIVTFASGLRLVHKPRDIGVEESWFRLLEFLNSRGGEFKLLRVLDRGTHGWVELARVDACADEEEARRYYARAGMLLAVLYALEASDCFHENIVACGAWPVLIDMETLMHHVLRRTGDLAPAEAAADDIVFDSVLRAGFLPAWEVGSNGRTVDISGLAAETGQVTPYQKRRWVAVNSDAMRLEHVPIVIETDDHLPRIGDRLLRAADYTASVVAGFQSMYRILLSRRAELEPYLEDLGRREIRVVFHATRIYGLLLKRLTVPQRFRSGIERSIETDILSRFYLDAREKGELWPILEEELEALERLDIPRFEVRADSRSITLPTGRMIEDVFEQTAVERVRQRLARLDEADLELQTGFITASLALSAVSVKHEATNGGRRPDAPRLSAEELVAEAVRIGETLERRAVHARDGCTWIAAQLLPKSSRHQLRPLRMDLYNGSAGVALFFAALERVAPGSGGSTARAALSPLRRFVAAADASRLAREGYTIGAATGAGAFVYALLRSGELLGDASLLEDARRAAASITPEWIAADDAYDVMSGAAGAALALLALHAATGDEDALARAVRCGEHLLAKRTFALTGFSHGAAGIAYALLRLAAATGDDRFARASAEATAWETSVFDEAEGNWPDLRFAGRAFMNAWCHGAAGIGMARLASLGIARSDALRRDVDAAISAVVRDGVAAKDGLCCGTLGRAELLVAANDDRAFDAASAVVASARDAGAYRLSGHEIEFFDPSLFQGLAGVGYALLRTARRDAVPSVLTWS